MGTQWGRRFRLPTSGTLAPALTIELPLTADPFRSGYKIVVTGPHGFERTVAFKLDDDPALIAERVRETVDEFIFPLPPALAMMDGAKCSQSCSETLLPLTTVKPCTSGI